MKTFILTFICAGIAFGQSRIDFNSQIKNAPPLLSDKQASFTHLVDACTAAVAAGSTLSISKYMTATPCGANLSFSEGGKIVCPTSGNIDLSGANGAVSLSAPLTQIFDVTAGCQITGFKATTVYPQWWGAKGDGVAIDTASVQAALRSGLDTSFVGNYRVGASLQMASNLQNVTFLTGSQIVMNADVDAIQVTGHTNRIINPHIYGAGTEPPAVNATGAGIGLFGSYNTVEGGEIANVQNHAVYMDGQTSLGHSGCGHNKVSGMIIHDVGGVGIAQYHCPENQILDNRISFVGREAVTIDGQSHNGIVANNRLDNACLLGATGGIGIDQSNGWVVANNVISFSTSGCSGIRVNNQLGPTSGGVISGNNIFNNTGYGIQLATGTMSATQPDYTFNITTSGNIFSNNTLNPYKVDAGSHDNVFMGNQFTGTPAGVVTGVNTTFGDILNFSCAGYAACGIWDAIGRLQSKGGFSDQSYVQKAPTTDVSATYTMFANTGMLMIDPLGIDITSGVITVVFPASPVDGQTFRLSTTRVVSNLTLSISSGSGQVIKNAPTSLAAGDSYGWIFYLPTKVWYRR